MNHAAYRRRYVPIGDALKVALHATPLMQPGNRTRNEGRHQQLWSRSSEASSRANAAAVWEAWAWALGEEAAMAAQS